MGVQPKTKPNTWTPTVLSTRRGIHSTLGSTPHAVTSTLVLEPQAIPHPPHSLLHPRYPGRQLRYTPGTENLGEKKHSSLPKQVPQHPTAADIVNVSYRLINRSRCFLEGLGPEILRRRTNFCAGRISAFRALRYRDPAWELCALPRPNVPLRCACLMSNPVTCRSTPAFFFFFFFYRALGLD